MLLASPRLSRFLVPSLMGIAAALISGCASSGDPQVAPTSPTTEQPASSVLKMSSPGMYAGSLTNKLNAYRQQTYSTQMNVAHNDVLYTAAFRHAKNLATANSAGVTTRPQVSTTTGPIPSTLEVQTITSASTLNSLTQETAPATGSQYPLHFTSTNRYNRVRAVVGGDSLLFSNASQGAALFESFAFNGNITANSGLNSEFRGFNQDLYFNAVQANASDNDFRYDVVDALWYTRRGRHGMIQPTMRGWAYASHNDNSAGMPYPYPILSGRFLGTYLAISDRPLTQQYGFWPNNGNRDVTPYGLDTDLQTVLTEVGGESPYCGPPMHVTLPVAEPFTAISLSFANITSGGYPPGPNGAAWPDRWKKLAIFFNQDPARFNLSVTLPDVTGLVKFNAQLNAQQDDDALRLRDGEFYFQTLGPLAPNADYRITFTIQQAQGVIKTQTIDFKTNNNSAFNN